MRNTKNILSEEEKVYKLIEILGRKNPHINTVDKVKNLIVWRDNAEEILQGVVNALMFRFEIDPETRLKALDCIDRIKANKPLKKMSKWKNRDSYNFSKETLELLEKHKQDIIDFSEKGIGNKKIALFIGCGEGTVSKYKNKMGIK